MAPDNSEEAYLHVLRVLLDAAIDTPVDLLLRGDNVTSLQRLRQLVKKPGLLICSLRWKDPNAGNKEKKLTDK